MNPIRITDSNITSLLPSEIFVFGSNRAGRHGLGAAKTALKWGAIMGSAEGLMGQTYGICTKDKNIQTLSVREIGYGIGRFIKFASFHPELSFLVTEIGCGLAGLKPKQIAPFFGSSIPDNIKLPLSFWKVLEDS